MTETFPDDSLPGANATEPLLGNLATHRPEAPPKTLTSLLFQLGVLLSVFVCPLDFSADGAKMTVGLDFQVLSKLAVVGLCTLLAIWSLATVPDTRRVLLTVPAIMVIAILCLAIPSALTSPSSSALPAVCVNLVYVVFVPAAVLQLGIPRTIAVIATAITAMLTLAWALYFFLPTYGVFPELLESGYVEYRLGGIGHPNSVGRISTIGMICLLYLWIYRGVSPKLIVPALTITLLALIYAQSRTSILCFIMAVSVVGAHRVFSRAGMLAAAAGSLAALVLLIGLFAGGQDRKLTDRLLGMVTKTGKAEELTSGTGRTEIWAKAIELISQKPLTGHGFGAAASLMVNHSQSTHNTVLHATMIAGVGGGAIMLLLQFWLIAVAIVKTEPLIRATSVLLFVSGLAEDTVLETFPGPATILWLCCILYPSLHAVSNRMSKPGVSLEASLGGLSQT